MSGRKLGGGRILGNGNGLGSPSPAHIPRAASPLTPSDSSTVSFHSRNSTLDSVSPPTSTAVAPGFLSQDLGSNINVGGPSTSAAASSRLVCPICDEEMVTLLQLNRHIDDVHQELPVETQYEVQTWFDKQVMKAKRFQPLSLINSKLRGLEVFEANVPTPAPPPPFAPGYPRPIEAAVDADELVTRKHWQRSTGSDVCTDPTCGKRLGPLNGNINCRNCGRLFCEEHTMYQMKLSRSATHDPVRGFWCRVCETCYKSREGYNDHNGAMQDHTAAFAAIRAKKVERRNLETQRLEKRLSKLTRVLAEAPAEMANGASLLAPVTSLAGQKNTRKLLEQSVVAWEDDQAVAKCPFCHQDFGTWTFRRHHCRTCGRVVCADGQTGCSSEVGLKVEPPARRPDALAHSEKPGITVNGQLSLDIRMCRECKDSVFSHRDFAEEVAHKPADQRAYETLRQFERGIRQLMPSFQRSLLALQSHEDARTNGNTSARPEEKPLPPLPPPPPRPVTHAQIQEAAKIRKRLTDSFAKYDAAARRIRDLKTTSPTQRRLQAAVYSAASSFLHAHLVPLKSVPAMLKAAHSSSLSPGPRRLHSAGSASSPLRNGELVASSNSSMAGAVDPETASVGGVSEASTALSALETQEREMKQRLIVLEEQRFMVNNMIKNARGARRFEEVSALTRNMEELDREISDLQRMVDGVEERWDGLYATGA